MVLAGALNKTPGAAQWLLSSRCVVVTGIILSFFTCIFALPTLFLFEKSTERLDLQMNGQGSDNKRELELRSAGIITVINSSSRGTASDGSIAQRCRGREMGEEGWPAAETVLRPTGPRCPPERLDKKSVIVPCPCSGAAPTGCRDPHLHRQGAVGDPSVSYQNCSDLRGRPKPSFPIDPQKQGVLSVGRTSLLAGRQSPSAGKKTWQQLRPRRTSWDNWGQLTVSLKISLASKYVTH